jgi:hypothetical protein
MIRQVRHSYFHIVFKAYILLLTARRKRCHVGCCCCCFCSYSYCCSWFPTIAGYGKGEAEKKKSQATRYLSVLVSPGLQGLCSSYQYGNRLDNNCTRSKPRNTRREKNGKDCLSFVSYRMAASFSPLFIFFSTTLAKSSAIFTQLVIVGE